jgi:hypothetical protein
MGWFNNSGVNNSLITELDNPYSLNILAVKYVECEIKNIYQKILMECYNHSVNLPESKIYFNSCLENENNSGLIILLANSMLNMGKLYLIREEEIIRKADVAEQQKIQNDYSTIGRSDIGIYCSFKNFDKTILLKVYYAILFNVFQTVNTQMGLSSSLQLGVAGLRDLIGLDSKDKAKAQAKEISDALKAGKGVIKDVQDIFSTTQTDISPVNASIDIINKRISSCLGMPISYLTGELSAGLSSTGEGDIEKFEEGLQVYFYSIWKPVIDNLFFKDKKDKGISFKKSNWRSLEVLLKNLSLIETSELLDDATKQIYASEIANRLQ